MKQGLVTLTLLIVTLSYLLLPLSYGSTGQVTSFTGQSNPFNMSFTGNQNQSFILPIPQYGYVQNVSLKLTSNNLFINTINYTIDYGGNTTTSLNPNKFSSNGSQVGSSIYIFNFSLQPFVNYSIKINISLKDNINGGENVGFILGSRNNGSCAVTGLSTVFNEYDCLDNLINNIYSYFIPAASPAKFELNLLINHNGTNMSIYNASNGVRLGISSKNYSIFSFLVGITGIQTGLNYSGNFSILGDVDLIINNIHNNLNIPSNSSLNTSLINSLLSGANLINMTFYKNSIEIIEINLSNASYDYGIDNCSNSFGIPSNASAFNFTTKTEATNTLLITNTSFNIKYYTDNPASYDTYAPTLYNKNNYVFCKYPAWAIFNATINNIVSAGGYENKNFNEYDFLVQGTLTAYLLEIGATTIPVTFTIKNTELKVIEGALFEVIRVIDGVTTIVYSQETNSNGEVIPYLNSEYTYTFNITADGYPHKSTSFQPSSSAYTIVLTSETTNFFANNYPYQGIRYKIDPPTSMWNISDNYVNLTFYLEGSNFEYWGINLTSDGDFACIPTDCSSISTAENGGNVIVSIKLNTTERFYTSLFYKREGETITYLNSYSNDAVIFRVATRGLIQMFADLKAHTSPLFRTIISAIIESVVVVISASFGIVGYPVMIVLAFIIIFLSLPAMPVLGFAGIGFIDPLVGLFMLIFGVGAYLFIEMSGGV